MTARKPTKDSSRARYVGHEALTASEPSPVRVVYVDPTTGHEIDPSVRESALTEGEAKGKAKAQVADTDALVRSIHRFAIGLVGTIPLLIGFLAWFGYRSQSPGTRIDQILTAQSGRDSLQIMRDAAFRATIESLSVRTDRSLAGLSLTLRDVAYQSCLLSTEGQKVGGSALCTNRFFRQTAEQAIK